MRLVSRCALSTVTRKTACDREECSFMSVRPDARCRLPARITRSISAADLHTTDVISGMQNPFSSCHHHTPVKNFDCLENFVPQEASLNSPRFKIRLSQEMFSYCLQDYHWPSQERETEALQSTSLHQVKRITCNGFIVFISGLQWPDNYFSLSQTKHNKSLLYQIRYARILSHH